MTMLWQAMADTPEETGSAEYFSGEVSLARFFSGADPAIDLIAVSFSDEARTNWHVHAEGQILWVVEGTAIVVDEDGEARLVARNEATYTPPGRHHWHGSAGGEVTHLSLVTGGSPTWGDAVDVTTYQDGIRRAKSNG